MFTDIVNDMKGAVYVEDRHLLVIYSCHHSGAGSQLGNGRNFHKIRHSSSFTCPSKTRYDIAEAKATSEASPRSIQGKRRRLGGARVGRVKWRVRSWIPLPLEMSCLRS